MFWSHEKTQFWCFYYLSFYPPSPHPTFLRYKSWLVLCFAAEHNLILLLQTCSSRVIQNQICSLPFMKGMDTFHLNFYLNLSFNNGSIVKPLYTTRTTTTTRIESKSYKIFCVVTFYIPLILKIILLCLNYLPLTSEIVKKNYDEYRNSNAFKEIQNTIFVWQLEARVILERKRLLS